MKKRNISLKLLWFVAAALLAAEPILSVAQTAKDKILMGIVSNHTRVFGVDDLFKASIDYAPWKGMVSEAQNFISTNAKGDKALVTPLNQLMSINDNLISATQRAYTSLKDRDALVKLTTTFDSLSKQAQQIETAAKKASFTLQSKKDARDVLVQLAMFIGTTASAAKNHLNKKIPLAQAKPTIAPRTNVKASPVPVFGGAAAQSKSTEGVSKGFNVRKK